MQNVIRKLFFKVNSLTELFENVKIDDVLSFLRETELFENVKIDDVLSFLRETGLFEKIWRIKTG